MCVDLMGTTLLLTCVLMLWALIRPGIRKVQHPHVALGGIGARGNHQRRACAERGVFALVQP